MAKLCSCYALCPLIDRSPLGVTADSVPGCVIVTLGKNIVIRYKLADQKQASSWSCKDKISAPVIYDPAGKQYVAVYNQSILRMWDSPDVDLNKIKKHKFEHPIHAVLSRPSPSPPVVVFKNGSVVPLPAALENRKKSWSSALSREQTIKDCRLLSIDKEDCVAIHASNEKGESVFKLITIDENGKERLTLPLRRSGQKLIGQTTMQIDRTAYLLTLWSDGQLWRLTLNNALTSEHSVGQLMYTLKAVSTKNNVAMTQISSHHLAIYGADPSEEGAMLIILNTQFLLVQARQHYKLFSGSANLWVIGSSLLLVVGHSLAVVPFLLDTERLSALVGSHRPLSLAGSRGGEVQQVLVLEKATWECPSENTQEADTKKSTTDTILKDVGEPKLVAALASQGYSQALLCEELVPALMKDRDVSSILWTLNNFPDFPEAALVSLLIFCLEEPVDTFSALSMNGKTHEDMDIDAEDSHDSKTTLIDFSCGQRRLIDAVIHAPLSEVVILPQLRTRLSLPHCLALLQHIAQSLPQAKDNSSYSALLRWAAVLLDSHYQQYLLSKDESVLNTLTALKDLIESQVEYMDDLKTIQPLLERLRSTHALQKPVAMKNYNYSIESIRLY